MSRAVEVVVLDVNESLSDLEPLRARFHSIGAPGHLLETWFASTLRDGFALAAAQRSKPVLRLVKSLSGPPDPGSR